MKTDFEKYERECAFLESIGFKKTYMAFEIGGGEDENDDDVFIRGEILLEWDYSTGLWSKHKTSEIDYSNFAYSNGETINIYDLK